ncbi:MAG: Uma2 family endonuclease, partial [Proteobacteria bacterium]|nr:Uma2 family endonuclease [Burkholderiales bacterium]
MGAIDSPTPLKLTIGQYAQMAEAGVFAPGARVELIEGSIYEMPPIGSLHAGTVDRIGRELTLRLGRRA